MAIEADITRKLGHFDDARGEYAVALKHYRKANKLTGRMLRTHAAQTAMSKHLDAVKQRRGRDNTQTSEAKSAAPADGPVSVIGFPGSGSHTLGA